MKTELCIKSGYSFLSSTLKIDTLIRYALDHNYTCLGLVDHNVMYGVKEFYDKCINNNIKPIIGLELEVEDFLICLLSKDEVGYKNIVKLSSYKNKSNDTYLTINDLVNHKEGLIGIVPSFRGLKDINKEKIFPLLNSLKDIYKEDFYVGKEIYNNRECTNHNLYIDTLEFNCVAFNNIVSKSDSDLEHIELLHAIEENKVIGYARKKEGFLYASFESEVDFTDNELNNVNVIKENCNFNFKKEELKLAKYENPLGIDSKEYLKNLVYKGLEKRNKEYFKNSIYIDRVNHELEVIFEMGFSDYFLVVYDYVRFAKEHGILVGPGRGSGASSLVSYCLGITNVNPLEYDLLFERFLNKERKTMPDIDIDFQDNKRDEIVNYLKNKYGYDNVANIVTFSTLSSKQALRDSAKALGLNKKDIELISKKAHKCPYNASLKEMFEVDEFKDFINSDDKYLDVYNIALAIEDLPRQTSMHAAGVVLSSVKLNEIVPTFSNNDKDLVIQYDMNYVESIGLLKMDILGLRNLTIIDECLKEIKRVYNVSIDLNKIDINDPKLYKVLSDGKTSGIFQFESEGMRKTLMSVKPNCFIDVCNVLSLYRPGPRDFIEEFRKRKHKLSKVSYVDDSLKDILESTYGIIIYQEQIILVAQRFAGFSLAKADILRRAMSKKDKDKMIELEEEFISSSISNGKDKDKAKKVFDLILRFASYGFNKSHSVAYTMISLYMTYLKVYYPSVFFASTMEMFAFSDKFHEYVKESKEVGIKLLLPSVNHSELEFKSIGDNKILYGLSHIKGLNTLTGKQIIKEANEKQFSDYSDFVFRMSKYKVAPSQFIALIDSGSLDEFGLNRATYKHNLDKLLKYVDMFGYLKDDQLTFDLDVMDKPSIEFKQEDVNKLELEKEVLGYYVSEFPLEKIRNDLRKNNIIGLNEINKFNQKNITFVGMLKSNKLIKTKKGELMDIVTFVDEYSLISVIIFPSLYRDVSKNLSVGKYYKIKGKVEITETISLIANEINEYRVEEN